MCCIKQFSIYQTLEARRGRFLSLLRRFFVPPEQTNSVVQLLEPHRNSIQHSGQRVGVDIPSHVVDVEHLRQRALNLAAPVAEEMFLRDYIIVAA